MPPTALRCHRRLLIGIAVVLAVFGSLSAWLWYGEARLPAAAPAEPKPALDGVGGLNIDSSIVVGPQSSIVRSERVLDDSADEIFTPEAPWPTDHKAVLTRFRIVG